MGSPEWIKSMEGELVAGTFVEPAASGWIYQLEDGSEGLLPEDEIAAFGEALSEDLRTRPINLVVAQACTPARGLLRREPGRPVVSFCSDELVRRLFARFVPEIAAGRLCIRRLARIPGVRVMVAVESLEPGLDAVAACQAEQGARLDSIRQALLGEPIDVVRFHPEPAPFALAALAPIDVASVELDEARRRLRLVVQRNPLHADEGPDAVRVKLVSILVGWMLDLHVEDTDPTEDELAAAVAAAIREASVEIRDLAVSLTGNTVSVTGSAPSQAEVDCLMGLLSGLPGIEEIFCGIQVD